MKIEITTSLNLKESENSLLDMHTFLNMLNVLIFQYSQIGSIIGEKSAIKPLIDFTLEIAEGLKDVSKTKGYLSNFAEIRQKIQQSLEQIEADFPDRTSGTAFNKVTTTISSILDIMEIRSEEWLDRMEAPEQWESKDIQSLLNNFSKVFSAIEQNSNGQCCIVGNIASQHDTDYFISLDFTSGEGDQILMPVVIQDVMRDLILNARKYTPRGGQILAGLENNGHSLRFVVQDNGVGIAPEEIEMVVEFGYRGKNVADKRTMGGGFGLTKAYTVTKRFGGRMWIESELDKGTTITIEIPLPV